MSITVVRDRDVTVVTVASDRRSMLPPLCQILRSLCHSPVCCSVRKGLMETDVTSALGTIQIMVGLFNLALGPGRERNRQEDFADLGTVYWLMGGVYIAAGITSLSSGRFPSLCLVGLAVFVNVVGSIFAVVGIVLYAIDLGDGSVSAMCDSGSVSRQEYGCQYVAYVAQCLLTAMDITMIVLAVLQLCVCISFAALGIQALLNKKKDEGDRDAEIYQPHMTDPAA